MKGNFKFLLLFFITAATGCGSKTPDNVSNTPMLDFQCQQSGATENSCDSRGDGKTVYIGLEENTAVNCVDQLSFSYPNQERLIHAFDYFSQPKADLSGNVLVGVASQWVNSNSMPVELMPKKQFKVCAFIDLNGNFRLDSGEAYHDSTLTIGSDFLPLTNWQTK